MHPSTERRIVRALTHTSTPWKHLAREWGVSGKTIDRIAKKHGITKRLVPWEEILKGRDERSA